MEQIFSLQTMIINSGVEEGGESALPLLESQKCWKTSRPTCTGNLHDPTPHRQEAPACSPMAAAIHPGQPMALDPCELPATPPQLQYPEHIIQLVGRLYGAQPAPACAATVEPGELAQPFLCPLSSPHSTQYTSSVAPDHSKGWDKARKRVEGLLLATVCHRPKAQQRDTAKVLEMGHHRVSATKKNLQEILNI